MPAKGGRMPVVDAHTHFIPLEIVELLASSRAPEGVSVEQREGSDPLIVHSNGLRYPVFPLFHDVEAKLAQMDRDGIDVSISSVVSTLFLYELEPADTLAVHRVINDAGAAMAARSGGRIAALACVPMNDPEAAAEELRRARLELGMAGVEIGPSVGDTMLDAAELDPFYAAADELGATVMIHPYRSMISPPGPDMSGYHLANVIGNPLETCVAATRLVVGGVFDRHPGLRVQLVHGGGAFPYQLGRLDHAYEAREETKSVVARTPSSYLDRFLFDTVIFERRALSFLLDRVGPEQVAYGTDVPFDMADLSAPELLPDLLGEEGAAKVLGDNALRAYGLVEAAGG
jgi:aminocarboxymuconate-semialdehyde decarboxylase